MKKQMLKTIKRIYQKTSLLELVNYVLSQTDKALDDKLSKKERIRFEIANEVLGNRLPKVDDLFAVFDLCQSRMAA